MWFFIVNVFYCTVYFSEFINPWRMYKGYDGSLSQCQSVCVRVCYFFVGEDTVICVAHVPH